MIEGILSDEEDHASDLSDLLFIIDPKTGETEGEDPGTHPLDIAANAEQSRQQSRSQSKADASSNTGGDNIVPKDTPGQKRSHHRELDVPATPRPGGGVKQPQEPRLGGGKNVEGVGNLVSGDKTVLESPERAEDSSSGKRSGKNNKNDKKRRK
jgi:hypothetical protein